MARRKLTEVIEDLNTAIAAAVTHNIEYYNLTKIQEKNEGIAVIARDGRNVSGKLASLKRAYDGIIYHRIIDENIDERAGKGRDSIQFINTDVRLVGWFKRPNIQVQPNWDDQEIMNEILAVVNGNTWLGRRETSKAINASSDFLSILEDEIGKVDQNKKLTYELTLFSIDYRIQQLQKCSF